MKEMKEDLSKWRDINGLEKNQHSKDVSSPQNDYRFNAIPIRITARFLIDTDKLVLKFIYKGTETKIDKTILKRKNEF